jgi:hypothetical protein
MTQGLVLDRSRRDGNLDRLVFSATSSLLRRPDLPARGMMVCFPATDTGLSGELTAIEAGKNSVPGRKAIPQGLKPGVFSIICGPTKVVP